MKVIYVSIYHKSEEIVGSRRTIVTISDEDKTWLEGYSKAYNVSVAEGIRQGIKRLRETHESETYHWLVEKTRGIWKQGDGLEYQMNIRSEWELQ
ncbi:MAG: hypothetical protein L6406_26235 [Desulfobacterales bacterium]|nr:hypothetical protein [Desulfobacterales bacterium]